MVDTRNTNNIETSRIPELTGLTPVQVTTIQNFGITKIDDIASLEDEAHFDQLLGNDDAVFGIKRKLAVIAKYLRNGGEITAETTYNEMVRYRPAVPVSTITQTPGQLATTPHSSSAPSIRTVNVHSLLLIKKIIDDKDDEQGVVLVGTIMQNIAGGEEHFEMRFNEESDDSYATRRSPTSNSYQLKVPLEQSVEFNIFPFVIKKATVAIEFSSKDDPTTNTKVRPQLMLHKEDRRNLVSIQNLRDKEDLESKLDHSSAYSLVSPYPEVRFLYEKKDNGYCPRYEVSFYLTDSGNTKLFKVTLPMMLIATINTVNVMLYMDGATSADNYLATAASLAVTAVLLLSDIVTPQPQKEKFFSFNTGYILMVFIGLILSSIPSDVFTLGNLALGSLPIYGMCILWLSFLAPIVNTVLYTLKSNEITSKMNKMNRTCKFLKDGRFKASKMSGSNHPYFPAAPALVGQNSRFYYEEEDRDGKFHTIEYK